MDTSSDDEAGDEELLMLLTVFLCFNEQNALPHRRCSTQGCLSSLIVKFFFEKGSITLVSASIDVHNISLKSSISKLIHFDCHML
jgi:hypothetical protein